MANYKSMTVADLKAELLKRDFDEASLSGLNKADLVKALEDDDAGQFENDEVDQDTALAGDRKVEAEKAEKAKEGEAVEPSEDDAKIEDVEEEDSVEPGEAVDIIRVQGNDRHYIRTFNSKDHDEDFREKALAYVNKEGREDHFVVESSVVDAVIVRFRESKKRPNGERVKVWTEMPFGGSVAHKGDAVSMANQKRTAMDNSVILVAKSVKIKDTDLKR